MSSPSISPPSVLVTGASGLLGRSVVSQLTRNGFTVTALSHSNNGPHHTPFDLRRLTPVTASQLVAGHAAVVHCAAERRPDACEADPEEAALINTRVPGLLAAAAAAQGAFFIHISTDYLWAGDKAPYSEGDPCAPPNVYGSTKRGGEVAVLDAAPRSVVLRLPVLYGPVLEGALSSSSVTMFAATVLAQGVPATVDDWQARVPTNTLDIGDQIASLVKAVVVEGRTDVFGILHYSAHEVFTRWGLCVLFGELLGVPVAHLTRNPAPPPGAARPRDCHLSTSRLEALGLYVQPRPFAVGVREVLEGAGVACV